MLSLKRFFVSCIVCISVIEAQIVFNDDDEQLPYSDVNSRFPNRAVNNYNYPGYVPPYSNYYSGGNSGNNNPTNENGRDYGETVEGRNSEEIAADETDPPDQEDADPQKDADVDYYDELTNGRRITDLEKFKRQQGCLCIKHLKDPHCGSDAKQYDNGCFFECAQKRNPRLLLKKWGPC